VEDTTSGAFNRTHTTEVVITLADGQQLVHALTLSGSTVRQAQKSARNFAAAVNSAAGVTAAPTTTSPADVLAQITQLHEAGLLTDDEFAAKRAEVIGRI
jgi:hypothetical protein